MESPRTAKLVHTSPRPLTFRVINITITLWPRSGDNACMPWLYFTILCPPSNAWIERHPASRPRVLTPSRNVLSWLPEPKQALYTAVTQSLYTTRKWVEFSSVIIPHLSYPISRTSWVSNSMAPTQVLRDTNLSGVWGLTPMVVYLHHISLYTCDYNTVRVSRCSRKSKPSHVLTYNIRSARYKVWGPWVSGSTVWVIRVHSRQWIILCGAKKEKKMVYKIRLKSLPTTMRISIHGAETCVRDPLPFLPTITIRCSTLPDFQEVNSSTILFRSAWGPGNRVTIHCTSRFVMISPSTAKNETRSGRTSPHRLAEHVPAERPTN